MLRLCHVCGMAASLALLVSAFPAQAGFIVFVGDSGSHSASVKFEDSGSDLLITLTNTSLADVLVPSDLLTAVFFDLVGDPALVRISAVLAPGSTVAYGPGSSGNSTNTGDDVGSEFGYKNGLSGAPSGASQGISSAGFGLFGPGDIFPGDNLDGPASPNGLNYGILSAGDDVSTGNNGLKKAPHVKNSVVFTLSGLSAGFSPLTDVSNVHFQYGTDLSEGDSLTGVRDAVVPEPSQIVIWGLGLAMAGVYRHRRVRI